MKKIKLIPLKETVIKDLTKILSLNRKQNKRVHSADSSKNSANNFFASSFSGFTGLFFPLTRMMLWILDSLFFLSLFIYLIIF